jgi:hypothetical protein
VSVIDVTDPSAPKLARELAASGHLHAVVGSVALTTSTQLPGGPETVTITSFADPAHPKMLRQFLHVTGLVRDGSRGLIYLANDEGLFILRESPTTDIDLQRQYEHDVIYNR